MASIRRMAEILSRGITLKRRIRSDFGSAPIYVTPDSQLKYLKLGYGVFDTDLVKIADRLVEPHHNVWDIGANVGVFSFSCAYRNKASVLAVEADIWLANVLRRTAALDTYSHRDIRILPVAVSDRNSIAEFLVASRGRASNALASAGGRSQMGGVRERVHVPCLTLDTIAETQPVPDFVKIDVEGAELAVLSGGERLFSTFKPTVYAEVGVHLLRACAEKMERHGYLMFGADGQPTFSVSGSNFFFVHQENAAMLSTLSRFRFEAHSSKQVVPAPRVHSTS